MRHLPRWMLFAVFVLILAIGAMSSLAVVTTRESFPQTNGQVTVDALGATVRVDRDEYGIPHVYADTPEDLFAAQGYVHAQDRFFEMDLRRHTTSGRLSELFGEDLVATDTFIRTLGWRQVAEQEAAALSGSTRRYLDAYAKGVNAWLATRSGGGLSLEYAVLGLTGGGTYRPEPWTVVDSLAWFKAMAWNLDGNRLEEIDRALAVQAVGVERAGQLWPARDEERFAPIVTRGAIRDGAFDPTATSTTAATPRQPVVPPRLADAAPALRRVAERDRLLAWVLGDPREQTIGSNSWALSPSMTSTGSAILSNDPHLATSIPSTFTQIGLHCTVRSAACPFDVTGFSFSGVPGVIIGKNADIAWGMTTPYVDTQDLFLEEIRSNLVRVGDEWEPITRRTEQLRVKGEDEPRTITIRSTSHGPLLSDPDPTLVDGLEDAGPPNPDDGSTGLGVSLGWSALTPGTTAEALFGINTATDFESFRAAARNLTSPSQNLLYADRQGNIGYQLPGAIPTRARGDGTLPRPGWDPSYDWGEPIPFEELPWDYNPPQGYLVAANQPVIGDGYPRLLSNGASYGWRSQMIIDRLSQQAPVSPQRSVELFDDSTVGVAGDLVPTLLRVPVDDPWVAEGQRTLVGWNYQATADSAEAAYFSIVYRELLLRTFGDEVGSVVDTGASDRWFSVLRDLIDRPDDPWWDDVRTEEVEDRDDILRAAMTAARREITVRLSEDPSGWRWGKLHTVTLQHPTFGDIGIGPLESVFNRGPVPVDGSASVINAMAWQFGRGDYTVATAPTMRMMIDFADPDNSQWINQSGVSGHASHPNYDDQFALWARGETITMRSTRTAVADATVDELELVPIG